MKTQISPALLATLKDRAKATDHVVLVMNTPNKNGRTYPTDVVVDAIANVQYPMLGCFMDDLNQGTIPLDRVSHKVLDLRIDGDNLIAKIVILETPMGQILQQLTDTVGIEYRTAGSCMMNTQGVVDKLILISIGA